VIFSGNKDFCSNIFSWKLIRGGSS